MARPIPAILNNFDEHATLFDIMTYTMLPCIALTACSVMPQSHRDPCRPTDLCQDGYRVDTWASTGVYFPNSVATRYIPAETRYTPAETRYTPAETRYTPAETRYIPAETRYIPAETRYIPAETRYMFYWGVPCGCRGLPCSPRALPCWHRVHAVLPCQRRGDGRLSRWSSKQFHLIGPR